MSELREQIENVIQNEDVALFMRDYDNVRSERLCDRECRTAVGAAASSLVRSS